MFLSLSFLRLFGVCVCVSTDMKPEQKGIKSVHIFGE